MRSSFSFLCLDPGTLLDPLCPAYSPSDIVGSAAKIGELLGGVNARIYRRPGGTPAAIFDSALATLQHRLDHLNQVQVIRQDVGNGAQYLNLAIGFYNDETAPENAIKERINVAISQDASWNTQFDLADGIKPACFWWHKEFLIMVLELKNTVGLVGNPVLPAIVNHSQIISQKKVQRPLLAYSHTMAYLWFSARHEHFREFCNFPTILVGVALTLLSPFELGTKLLTFDVTSGFLVSDNIVRLARVFGALSSCWKDLTLTTTRSHKKEPSNSPLYFPSQQPWTLPLYYLFSLTNSFCPELVNPFRFL